MPQKIGETLVHAGLISRDDLQAALTEQRRTGERMGAVFVRLNLATEKQVTRALAQQLGVPYVSLDDGDVDPSVVGLIPRNVALKGVCVALRYEHDCLTVAVSKPLLFSMVQEMEVLAGCEIRQVVASRADILQAIEKGYAPAAHLAKMTLWGAEQDDDARCRPSVLRQPAG